MTQITVSSNNFSEQYQQERDQLVAAFEQVAARGDFVLGQALREFEERFSDLCHVRFSVGVGSGTDALILALRALGIGVGDEVLTVSNTWVSTVSSIALVGATPVFVDVADDMNIDPDLVEAAVTPRTKAILPVHLTGRPARMDRIQEIARQNDLFVIEDAAQAVGASLNGKQVGSFGEFGCFSLHPLKNLNACGDGGIIVCEDEDRAAHLKLLRNHGLVDRDHVKFWAGCSRLDSLQAAILLTRLSGLEAVQQSRRETAAFYNESLRDCVTTPESSDNELHVYHTYVIQTPRRDELQGFLAERGISAKVHYPIPIHLQEAAAGLGYGQGSLPNTERLCNEILTLPVNQYLTVEQKTHVVDSVQTFFN